MSATDAKQQDDADHMQTKEPSVIFRAKTWSQWQTNITKSLAITIVMLVVV